MLRLLWTTIVTSTLVLAHAGSAVVAAEGPEPPSTPQPVAGDTLVVAETLGGQTLEGRLVSLTAEQLTLDASGHTHSVPVAELLSIDLAPPGARPAAAGGAGPAAAGGALEIESIDGSRWTAAAYQVEGDTARLTLAGERTIEMPLGTIRWIRSGELSAGETQQWNAILAERAAGDLLVIRKDAALDYLEGVVRAVTDELVEFELDGETFRVKRPKVAGLVYYRPHREQAVQAAARIELEDRGSIAARRLSTSGDSLRMTTPSGIALEWPIAEVARIDFSAGKLVHLSELDWERDGYERTSFFGVPRTTFDESDLFRPRRDTSFSGEPLLLDGRACRRGLALHSRTRLAYLLPGEFRRLSAVAGIDDRAGERGHVRLVIEGDGRTLLDVTIASGDPPLPIDVDLRGVRRLGLLVDFGGDTDVGDHLNLCDARLLK